MTDTDGLRAALERANFGELSVGGTARHESEVAIVDGGAFVIAVKTGALYHPKGEAKANAIVAAVNALPSLLDRIAALEAENFALAAGQCIYRDGSGLIGDEHGNQVCLKADRVVELEDIARAVSDLWGDNSAWGDEASVTRLAGKFGPIALRARAALNTRVG